MNSMRYISFFFTLLVSSSHAGIDINYAGGMNVDNLGTYDNGQAKSYIYEFPLLSESTYSAKPREESSTREDDSREVPEGGERDARRRDFRKSADAGDKKASKLDRKEAKKSRDSRMSEEEKSAATSAENLNKCVDAALGGDEQRKHLKILDHRFHCYPVRETKSSSARVFKGKLSHALRFRKDDQVRYQIRIERKILPAGNTRCTGKYTDVDINRGGLAPIPGTVASWIGKYDFENDWREAAKDWDGNWESAAYMIVYKIRDELLADYCPNE